MKNNKNQTPVSAASQVEKEKAFRQLTTVLEGAGFRVRREKLKRGHGWKTVSGKCRAGDEKLIFVDRLTPIEEQVLFLKTVAGQLGLAQSA